MTSLARRVPPGQTGSRLPTERGRGLVSSLASAPPSHASSFQPGASQLHLDPARGKAALQRNRAIPPGWKRGSATPASGTSRLAQSRHPVNPPSARKAGTPSSPPTCTRFPINLLPIKLGLGPRSSSGAAGPRSPAAPQPRPQAPGEVRTTQRQRAPGRAELGAHVLLGTRQSGDRRTCRVLEEIA